MEQKRWTPEFGVMDTADLSYIRDLVSELELYSTSKNGLGT
jgi:hypothetical protein